jgi:hypothetical protein
MNFDAYRDIRPWQYYVDSCSMKQEALDLMSRSIEYILIHTQVVRNDLS